MNNPLVQKVDTELERLGLQGAELIRESYHNESFGNASAVYRLGNLYCSFSRDRGHDTVGFLNQSDQGEFFTFSDMSLVMGWITLDELLTKYRATDFSEPPPGPIPLSDALGLIVQHHEQLQGMFSPSETDATLEQLRNASKMRCKAIFGA